MPTNTDPITTREGDDIRALREAIESGAIDFRALEMAS